MDTSKRHRYVSALVAAGALFIVGTVVVVNRAGISSSGNSGGLNINGVIQTPTSALPIPQAPPSARPAAVDIPLTNISTTTKKPAQQPVTPAPDTSFDWNSFVTMLTHGPKPGTSSTTSGSASTGGYSYLPTNLVSLPVAPSTYTMPESQKPLYAWGQEAGGSILSYEKSHPNQPAILTDYIQDRQNPAKIAAMKQLGADLEAVGENIANIGQVPPQMKTAGKGLADAYHEIGKNLAAIPDAKGDDATVKAILFYDKSAEAFVQKYVNVVNILQANGIRYSQDEPGGVFMFPAN